VAARCCRKGAPSFFQTRPNPDQPGWIDTGKEGAGFSINSLGDIGSPPGVFYAGNQRIRALLL